MELIVRGIFQGQLAYGQELFPDLEWVDGAACSLEDLKSAGGVFDFQELVRRLLEEKELPEDLGDRIYEENPDLIVIANEVGSGVVPVDPLEREFREKTGRICTCLAGHSHRVHRVICGIGKVIKDA